jgi:hypothetical protein
VTWEFPGLYRSLIQESTQNSENPPNISHALFYSNMLARKSFPQVQVCNRIIHVCLSFCLSPGHCPCTGMIL